MATRVVITLIGQSREHHDLGPGDDARGLFGGQRRREMAIMTMVGGQVTGDMAPPRWAARA